MLGNVQESIQNKMKERKETEKPAYERSKKTSFLYEPSEKSLNPIAEEERVMNENKQLINHIRYLQK